MHPTRSPSEMLSATIRPTNAASPPSVTISVEPPVQTLRMELRKLNKTRIGSKEGASYRVRIILLRGERLGDLFGARVKRWVAH